MPFWRRLTARLRGRGPAEASGEEDCAEFYGRRIARRRDKYQFGLVTLALLTVWLSYETLVGQRLILESQRFAESWTRHEEAVQKASREVVTLVNSLYHTEPSREPQLGFKRYCDYVLRTQSTGGGGQMVATGPGASIGAGAEADLREFFMNFDHQRLCNEQLALRSRAASLEQVFGRWFTDISPVVGLLRLPGTVYGDVQAGLCLARLWASGRLESSQESWE